MSEEKKLTCVPGGNVLITRNGEYFRPRFQKIIDEWQISDDYDYFTHSCDWCELTNRLVNCLNNDSVGNG